MEDEDRRQVLRLAWWKVRNAAAFFSLQNGNDNPPWQRPFNASDAERHLLACVIDFNQTLGRVAFGATDIELREYLPDALSLARR